MIYDQYVIFVAMARKGTAFEELPKDLVTKSKVSKTTYATMLDEPGIRELYIGKYCLFVLKTILVS